MKYQDKIENSIQLSITTKQLLLTKEMFDNIEKIGIELAKVIKNGGKIMFCGNGGSAADSQHLAAELVVRLRSSFNRPAIPAIALTVDTSVITACGNDFGYDDIFSRQIEAIGNPGDALIAISTSGNSKNVLQAINIAKQKGISVVGFLGGNGGQMLDMCNYYFLSPSSNTARIQETHIMVGHILCEIIEEELFN
jgi:D-sedoheptulose 7-phosphate isomerase